MQFDRHPVFHRLFTEDLLSTSQQFQGHMIFGIPHVGPHSGANPSGSRDRSAAGTEVDADVDRLRFGHTLFSPSSVYFAVVGESAGC